MSTLDFQAKAKPQPQAIAKSNCGKKVQSYFSFSPSTIYLCNPIFNKTMQASIRRTIPKLRNPLYASTHFAQFHSTPILLAKSKNNNKAQIRFAVRQKRADTKRALKDFLLYGKSSKLHSQDDGDSSWYATENSSRNTKAKNNSHDFDGIPRSKSSRDSKPNSSTASGRGKHKPWQRKQRSYDIDDDMNPENIFEATFGGQKCYTWSFTWTENFNFDETKSGFNFGGESRREKAREKFWCESDDEEEVSTAVGCHSHRVTLGLPLTGPLKLDDIKSAFRASALKWHPDKHQGSSQAMAEEKFKLCVNAYNSLCSAVRQS